MSSTTAGWAGPTWASPPRPTAWWYTGPPTATATPPSGPGSCSSPRTAERPGTRSVSDPVTARIPGGSSARFQDEAATDGGQELQDAGGAAVGVLTEAAVVHQGEVAGVVVHVSSVRDGDAQVAGDQRGQRDQLTAVDGDAAQRLVSRGDAERCPAQVHVGTAGLGEIRPGQRAVGEADPPQRGAAELRVAQQAVLERHVGERAAAEVHRVQLAVAEGNAAHRGREGLDPGQRAAGQRSVQPAGFGQVAGHEPDLPQAGVGESGPPQPAAVEGGASELAVQEVAVPGVGVGERGGGERQAVVLLLRLQAALVRGELTGHGPDPTGPYDRLDKHRQP